MTITFLAGRGGAVPTLPVAAALLLAVGCTSSSGGGSASASCAYRVTYEGRTYGQVANASFEVGERLGTVSFLPCDDTGRRAESEKTTVESTAYAVEGLDAKVAIAVGDTPDDVVFAAVDPGKRPTNQDLPGRSPSQRGAQRS
ncbi:DUF6281 family protein [Streptomyces chryseus]|uniref:DUF6281 family protein n=1 Tax=Streptomyces chryseus TaxID=68186 RepID=UPI0016755539|nr:DUF6281 family protein [Streptomyces chryseus]GGX31407.1 hypothetical protein GCM10010353_53060 [Streptomyces chryseus]